MEQARTLKISIMDIRGREIIIRAGMMQKAPVTAWRADHNRVGSVRVSATEDAFFQSTPICSDGVAQGMTKLVIAHPRDQACLNPQTVKCETGIGDRSARRSGWPGQPGPAARV